MEPKEIAVIGAGGCGREVAWLINFGGEPQGLQFDTAIHPPC